MIKLKKNIINLIFVFNILCLNFNASASNLNDLPDEITKTHILLKCDLWNILNHSNISQVSHKFYNFIYTIDTGIIGKVCPGIKNRSELEKIIKDVFEGKPIAIYPSTDEIFNKCFDLEKSLKRQNSFLGFSHNVCPLSLKLSYPCLHKAIVKYQKNGDVTVASLAACSRYFYGQHYRDAIGQFCDSYGQIIVYTDYLGIWPKCADDIWPFQSITKVLYREYLSSSLLNNNEELIRLVDEYHKDLSSSKTASIDTSLRRGYAYCLLPEEINYVDYIVFGRSKLKNKEMMSIYRFGQQKRHNEQLIKGLNDGSLPRR